MTQAELADADLSARLLRLLTTDRIEGLAVRATFDPQLTVPPEDLPAVALLSDEVVGRRGREERILKERVRIDLLVRILRRGGPEDLRRVRRARTDVIPGALQTVLDQFIDGRPFVVEQQSEAELMAALHVIRWVTTASSLAGRPDAVPPGYLRDEVEGRLARMETLRPIREITADGCVGREDELARLHRYLERTPPYASLYDLPATLLYGIGGVGKSTLVAQFVREVAEATEPPAWAYLDLDRPSLSSFDPLALLRDMVRQVGSQFPHARRLLDNQALLAVETSYGVGLESVGEEPWRRLAEGLIKAVDEYCAGRLVVIVDTYEELQRHEARTRSHLGDELYRMFARLSDGLARFRLVVCGRAPATAFVASGSTRVPQEVIPVVPLRPAAAAEALQLLYLREVGRAGQATGQTTAEQTEHPRPLDAELIQDVVSMVGRSPLTLKLAARVLAREGGAAVQEAAGVAHAAERAHALDRIREGFVEGFLYHRILRHLRGIGTVQPEVLRDVARACIPLRRITPDVLREVVLPVIKSAPVDTADLMAGLAAEAAFAAAEADGLRLREELRGPALLALRFSDPTFVTTVHRRAAEYYARLPDDPRSAAERAYHVLAGGSPVDVGTLDLGAVRQLDGFLDDLPPDGRDLVTATLADPSAMEREVSRRARAREVDAAVTGALAAGDLDLADRLLEDRSWWTATTELHRAVSLAAERRGDLAAAVEAARRDVGAAEAARDPVRFVAGAIRLALLEERLHGGEAGATSLAEADGRPWLGEDPLLHLELRLNRLAMLERHGIPHDSWLQRLEARALLQRCDPRALRDRTAVVRLLAATLGAQEPRLVLDAVRAVGLGTTTYSTHLIAVARALAAWDVEPEPGGVARQIGLWVPEPATPRTLLDVWTAAVVSPQSDTVVSLERAFAYRPPDAEVLAAVRQVYLWWGVDPEEMLQIEGGEIGEEGRPGQGSIGPARGEDTGHFLDGGLDFSDADLQRLVRTLRGAYPKAEDVQSLASRAGLDLTNVNWRQTSGRVVHDVLEEADNSERLGSLLGEAITDPSAAPFRSEFQDIVGLDWLSRQGIVDS